MAETWYPDMRQRIALRDLFRDRLREVFGQDPTHRQDALDALRRLP